MSIYKNFEEADKVPSNKTIVTTGLWTGDVGFLEGSSSLQLYDVQVAKSGEYYFDLYDINPNTGEDSDLAEVQMAITYGHVNGGGAPTLANDEQAKLPTKVIYSQYRNLLLGDSEDRFSFEGAKSDQIYVINFQRARVREQLDPGNWELPLSGANGIFTFIDDSNETLEAFTQTTSAGRVYKVVSGSIDSITGSIFASNNATSFNGQGYGLAYPDLGIIVLNPNAIGPMVGFFTKPDTSSQPIDQTTGSFLSGSNPFYTSTNVVALDNGLHVPYAPLTSSIPDANWNNQKSAYNHAGLYVSMKQAISNPNGIYEIKARSAETISSTHYFVRLRAAESNYSNNPTFRDTDDTIIIPSFKADPNVYITTIGLYNDNNELLSVAKLSKPVRKSFTEEVLLRVRLDY